jgi:hypothetical protein
MSKEISTQQTSLSGATLYATIDRGGQRWNGTAFEAIVSGHWSTYAVALTEAAGTGYFSADIPAGINTPGRLEITIYRQIGGTPATTDPVVASGSIDWSGTSQNTLSGVISANVTQFLGAAPPTPNVPGVPLVDIKYMNGAADLLSDGTATGGTTNSITLGTGVSFPTNVLRDRVVTIVAGLGNGQSELIASNTNANPSVVTLYRNWLVTPDATSKYTIDVSNASNLSAWLGVVPNPLVSQNVPANATVSLGANAPDGWIRSATFAADAIDGTAFAQAAANKVWATTTRTLTAFGFSVVVGTNNDKLGYSLTTAPPTLQEITDAVGSGGGGTATVDPYLLAYAKGDVVENSDGSWTFFADGDPGTPMLKYVPRGGLGGRHVVKDTA